MYCLIQQLGHMTRIAAFFLEVERHVAQLFIIIVIITIITEDEHNLTVLAKKKYRTKCGI